MKILKMAASVLSGPAGKVVNTPPICHAGIVYTPDRCEVLLIIAGMTCLDNTKRTVLICYK